MSEKLMADLRASVLLEAMREIEEIADDESDITNSGGPNAAMKIAQIARSAMAQANIAEPMTLNQRALIIAAMLRSVRNEGIETGIRQAETHAELLEKAS